MTEPSAEERKRQLWRLLGGIVGESLNRDGAAIGELINQVEDWFSAAEAAERERCAGKCDERRVHHVKRAKQTGRGVHNVRAAEAKACLDAIREGE